MKTKTSTWIIIVLIIIIIIAIIIKFIPIKNQSQSKETIKIGWIGPLTGFGAAWGLEQQRVLDLEVNRINNAGGINGKKLEIIYEDGKCDPKEATTAAQKLINVDNIKILMSICSTESLAIAPIANNNKIIQVAVWSTTPKITNSGNYTFRVSYSDADIAKIMSETFSKKYKKVGMITELNDYNIGLSQYFKEYYKGEINEETYDPYSKDFRTLVNKILKDRPEIILMNPNNPSAAIEILDQLKELGFKGQIYANFIGESSVVLNDNYSNGIIFFSDPVVEDSSIKKELFNEYKTKFGKKPDFEFGVSAQYDSIYLLKQSIENCNDDSECIKYYFHNMKNFTGILGTYHFDKFGDATGFKPAIKEILNHSIVKYEN